MSPILFSLLIAASSAPPEACNIYVSRDYNGSIRLEERERTIIVTWNAWNETLEKVVTKTFGALTEGAYDPENPTEPPYVFTRTKVDGIPAIILESIIFFPDCPKGHK